MNINMNQIKNESFDLWSGANFVLWSKARYDFELIAELLNYIESTSLCLSLLNTVNNHIQNAPSEVFFDGTIKSLKFLIKNNYLNISDLSEITNGHKHLKRLLKKYSKKIDIIDVFFDIEEPTLGAMLIEYPHLLNMILEDSLGQKLINEALIKNGITDYDSFIEKIDNDFNSKEVNEDKYSKEAMKCKIIYLGLRMKNKKFFITKNCTETIKLFSTLTDQLIESEDYSKGIINAIYASFYGSNKWNKEKKVHLTGCQLLQLNFQLLSSPENHMSTFIYEMLLKNETEKIGKKYFGDSYSYEGFVASLAIKMVIVIIIFRSQDFIPKDEKPEVNIFGKGALLDGLNYAVKETEKNGKKMLKPKQWFIDYYRKELDKRMAFIKFQVDNNISVVELKKNFPRVIYLPVFESFKFFCSQIPHIEILKQIIRLFTNRDITNEIKDDILINFVLNIQKIVSQKKDNNKLSEEENYFKNAFIILIEQIFKNLIKKMVTSLKLHTKIKSYYEESDLFSDASVSIMELIFNFDLTKNNSFIGYLTYNLNLKIKTKSRPKKSEQFTTSESNLKDGFMNDIPDETNLIEEIHKKENILKIKKYINNLPEKQKEAIKKYYEKNERLSEAERRNKNRGLNNIKKAVPVF
jgi:DNA-directed RNA polymerase specialized sigma subunit